MNYVANAIKSIAEILDDQHAVIVAWSGGKDSSTTLNLVLTAALARKNAGASLPKIIVTHANVGIENPAIMAQVQQDVYALENWARLHHIDVDIKIAEPYLNDCWQVRVIGGRDLPVFSGVSSNRKCTQELKIKPQARLTKSLVKDLKAAGKTPVTITGTRYAEGNVRARNMSSRGETANELWFSKTGDARLSPIADWSDADLWRYLHACINGKFESYADFSGLVELYRAGSNPANIHVIDDVEVFSARFGCSLCTVGKDKSMAWMLKNNPDRYGYMQGLHDLQQYLLNSQNDLTLRQWVNFKVSDDGYVKIRPNTYSPTMLEDLLRMCLTLDVKEGLAAQSAGVRPRFKLIDFDVLIAIDAIWSLQGHRPAHHALHVWREVVEEHQLMDIPKINPVKKTPVPAAKYAFLGTEWQEPTYRYAGLRDVASEFATENSGCMGNRALSNGKEVLDVETSLAFSVDYEAACDFYEFEMERILEEAHITGGYRFNAYQYYARMGIVSLSKGTHISKIDSILRRTMWKECKGLLDYDWRIDPERLQQLLDSAISEKELEALRLKKGISKILPAPKSKTSLVQATLFDLAV